MTKKKRKLTLAQKAKKARRKAEFMTIFINGKQKRVRRPPTIDGMDVDEFIQRSADPIWLHQNEMWEDMMPEPEGCSLESGITFLSGRPVENDPGQVPRT
jgi:hypothetical protein